MICKDIATRKQFLAGAISSYTAFCFASGVAWPSSVGFCLHEDNCYHIAATVEQWEWTNSLLSLGAACWSLPMGALMKYRGSKTLMFVQLVPYVIASFLLIFANSIYMLYASRYLLGMCGAAVCVAVPVYLGEIAQKERRGAVGSMFFGGIVYGVICTHILTIFFGVKVISVIHLVQAVFCLAVIYIPESPIFYAHRGDLDMAYSSMRWLRGQDYDLNSEMQELTTCRSNIGMDRKKECLKGMRGTSRGTILLMLFQLSGFVVIVGYLYSIFDDQRKDQTSKDVSSLMACLFLGYLTCFLLIDIVGRRLLLIISSAGIIISTAYLTIYFRLLEYTDWSWSPFLSFGIYIFFFSIGFGPVSWVVTVELIFDPYRPYGCAAAATVSWFLSFLLTRWLAFALDSNKVFFLLILVSMIGFVFVLVFIPETKGLSTTSIQQELSSDETPGGSIDSL